MSNPVRLYNDKVSAFRGIILEEGWGSLCKSLKFEERLVCRAKQTAQRWGSRVLQQHHIVLSAWQRYWFFCSKCDKHYMFIDNSLKKQWIGELQRDNKF